MSDYYAPIQDMQFVIDEIAGLDAIAKLPNFEDATPDLVAAVLELRMRCDDRLRFDALQKLRQIADQSVPGGRTMTRWKRFRDIVRAEEGYIGNVRRL